MLALMSFPLFRDAIHARGASGHLWAAGLVLFVICCGGCAWKLWQTPEKSMRCTSEMRPQEVVAGRMRSRDVNQRALWLLLPACASALLLATTNMICQDVAVIPFLWVLPLALYLLSFIICFDSPRWYMRVPFGVALSRGLGGICWAGVLGTDAPLLQLGASGVGLFVCCMVCHGELYRLKPDPRHLTGYYLMIAAGGALGGTLRGRGCAVDLQRLLRAALGPDVCGLLFLVVCLRSALKSSAAPDSRRFELRWLACGLLAVGLVALGIALWAQARSLAA